MSLLALAQTSPIQGIFRAVCKNPSMAASPSPVFRAGSIRVLRFQCPINHDSAHGKLLSYHIIKEFIG